VCAANSKITRQREAEKVHCNIVATNSREYLRVDCGARRLQPPGLCAERMMGPLAVVVIREVDDFPFKIPGVPKEDVVKVFTTDCADQSFNEWMRLRRIRDGLDLIDLKDAKISFPSVVSK
jgi:hypothetical protein